MGRTWRTAPSVIVECHLLGCGYCEDASGTTDSDNARQRAKRHAETTGHTVRVERTITTIIEGSVSEAPPESSSTPSRGQSAR